MDSPTKYDDLDYHDGPAMEAGQPPENGFTHMGLMLAWLIRHDLHDPGMWPEEHVRAVKTGAMTGSDMADDCDGKLISDMFTSEGAAFLAARYDAYMAAWDRAFGERPAYSVVDTTEAYEAVAPIIGGLHAEWNRAGRPVAPPSDPSPRDAEIEALIEGAGVHWATIAEGADGPTVVEFRPDGTHDVRPLARPHEAAELEAAIPRHLTDPPMDVSSVKASQWGSSLVNRALKRLGVGTRDAMVVAGMGGRGDRTLSATIYAVPGVAADRLLEEFATVIYKPGRGPWRDRDVGGRSVRWADATDRAPFSVAWWTRDGLVFHLAGDEADVLAAVPRFE